MTSRTPLTAKFALCLGLFGCVPQARYDDTKKALDQATETRDSEKRRGAQLELELAEAQAALAALSERTAAAEAALEAERTNLAQARFESDVIGREREDAKLMSEQLLVELERVAGHLRAYADDKAALDEELTAARTRLSALAADEKANQERFLAARELTLALAEPLEKKAVRLALVDGEIAIQFPRQSAFDDGGATLTESGKAALKKAASVLTPLALDVQVEQPNTGEDVAARAKSVSDALVRFGLAKERVIVPAVETAATAETGTSNDEAALDGAPDSDVTSADDTAAEEPSSLAEATPKDIDSGDTELELRLRFPS